MAQISMQVISVDKGKVVLQGQRASACTSCASKSSCLTVNPESPNLINAEFSATQGLELGQNITLNCQDSFLLKAILAALMPALLGLISFALLANQLLFFLTPSVLDIACAGFACLGFVLGLLVSRRLSRGLASELRNKLSLKPTP